MKYRVQSKQEGQVKIIHLNRRIAIRERCVNCAGFQYAEVHDCIEVDCPLYTYRLRYGKQNPKERAKHIHAYCIWCSGGSAHEVTKCTAKDCALYPFRQGWKIGSSSHNFWDCHQILKNGKSATWAKINWNLRLGNNFKPKIKTWFQNIGKCLKSFNVFGRGEVSEALFKAKKKEYY